MEYGLLEIIGCKVSAFIWIMQIFEQKKGVEGFHAIYTGTLTLTSTEKSGVVQDRRKAHPKVDLPPSFSGCKVSAFIWITQDF